MEFGYHHVSFDDPDPAGAMLDRARRLEEYGFSLFTAMDHFWQLSGNGYPEEPLLDCYTALPAVAAVTDRMELSALVTCPGYRTPGYLARAVASLDAVADGRALLGIGAGWYAEEYAAYGYEFPDPATRVRGMVETIQCCRALFSEPSPVTWRGEHYAVEDAVLEPKPEEVPVMVGGSGEQLLLRAVAEEADRWNLPGPTLDSFEHKRDVLADHCERAGRSVSDIEVTVLQTLVVRETDEGAHEAYESLAAETEGGPAPRDEHRGLVGAPATVAESIAEFDDRGTDRLLVKVPKNDPETVERFADEVMGEFA